MKTIVITVLSTLLLFGTTLAQRSKGKMPTSKSSQHNKEFQIAINDFADKISFDYNYGNGHFKAAVIEHYRRKGIRIPEVAVKIENLSKNIADVDDLLDMLWVRYGGDRELVFSQLEAFRMKASNAKLLTDYVISKHSENIKGTNTHQSE